MADTLERLLLRERDERVRRGLAAACEAMNFHAAAAVLAHEKQGAITLPRSLMDTRDGREEAIAALQEAFERGLSGVVIVDA